MPQWPEEVNQEEDVETTDNKIGNRESMERQEETKRKLQKRGIPEGNWQYYLNPPHTMDYTIISSSGLCKGVEAALLSPTTCLPIWVVKESIHHYVQLRAKLKEVIYAKNEMDKFKQSENPDDDYFMVSFKPAGKKADKLKSDLQTACNALEYTSIEDNNCFGEDFLNNLMDFSRATAGNNNAQDKVESLKALSAERGIVMHQTKGCCKKKISSLHKSHFSLFWRNFTSQSIKYDC